MIALQLEARVSLDHEREIPLVGRRTEEQLGLGFFDSSLLHLLEIFRFDTRYLNYFRSSLDNLITVS